jgi:hypothetical protein
MMEQFDADHTLSTQEIKKKSLPYKLQEVYDLQKAQRMPDDLQHKLDSFVPLLDETVPKVLEHEYVNVPSDTAMMESLENETNARLEGECQGSDEISESDYIRQKSKKVFPLGNLSGLLD